MLSCMIHLLSFFRVDLPDYFPFLWTLHVGIFLFFLPMAFFSYGKGAYNSFWEHIKILIPGFWQLAIILLIIYVPCTFGFFMYRSGFSRPREVDGEYFLIRNRMVIKQLSPIEYEYQKCLITRAFSSAWLVFYLLPALYFQYIYPHQHPDSPTREKT